MRGPTQTAITAWGEEKTSVPAPSRWAWERARRLAWIVVLAGVVLNPPAHVSQAQENPAPQPRSRPAQGRAVSPEGASATTSTPASPRQVSDLSTRYRFIERYTTAIDRTKPRELAQYRVSSQDVIRVVREKSQGTPDRTQTNIRVIYTERPAQVNSSGVVTDVVRRYEAIKIDPLADPRPSAPKILVGRDVWSRQRQGGPPLLMTLSGGPPLSETEYSVNNRLSFFPNLVGLLPAMPSRVGDRWPIPQSAASALLGERPVPGEPLVGTLLQVSEAKEGTDLVAQIGVSGRVMMPPGNRETLVNAEVAFTFGPPTPGEGNDTATTDARGAITEIRLSASSASAIPGGNRRLKATFTHERTIYRQMAPADAVALPVPSPPPIPTEANSWLTYDDPKGRFHFRHSQEFFRNTDPVLEKDENVVQLVDARFGTNNGRILTMVLQPKTNDPAADKANRDPEARVKQLNESWIKNGSDVLRGPRGWLPEADWAPNKMRIYRIEAALRPAGPAGKDVPRIFLDDYLVLFSQNESLSIEAMTGQEDPKPFRKEVEAILKTFQLGPSGAAGS